MKTATLLTAILISVLSCNLSAQDYPSGSLFWKISGNGLEHDSYLFGTWHGSPDLCIDFLDTIPQFYETFTSVNQVLVESFGSNTKENGDVIMKSLGELRMPQDTVYRDLLDEADITFLDSVLLKYIGATSSEIHVRPNFLTLTVGSFMLAEQYTDPSGEKCTVVMDNYLIENAVQRGSVVRGLDTPDIEVCKVKELYFSGNIPVSLQESADFLMTHVKKTETEEDEETKKTMLEFIDAYRNQDLNT